MARAVLSAKTGGPSASLNPYPASPLPVLSSGALSNKGGKKADGHHDSL